MEEALVQHQFIYHDLKNKYLINKDIINNPQRSTVHLMEHSNWCNETWATTLNQSKSIEMTKHLPFQVDSSIEYKILHLITPVDTIRKRIKYRVQNPKKTEFELSTYNETFQLLWSKNWWLLKNQYEPNTEVISVIHDGSLDDILNSLKKIIKTHSC